MKKIKYKPYAKTSYLPNHMLVTDSSPLSEWKHLFQLQKKELGRLNLQIEHQQKIIQSLSTENERLQAVNKGHRAEMYGRSSEKLILPTTEIQDNEDLPQSSSQTDAVTIPIDFTILPKHPRGGKPGHKGYGRKIPDLPELEVFHDMPDPACCSACSKPFADTGLTEDSYEVHYEARYVRIKHRRKRSIRTCECPGVRILTAPKPPQVIPKGKFSHGFLAYVLVMKYFFQVPLHRLLHMMQFQGLAVNESTLISNFDTLNRLLSPLYERLVQINKEAAHWHVDETGWKIFTQSKDKLNFNWWLWVFACKQTVVYVVDASRAASVLLKHFGESAQGVVSSDRFSAYLMLSRLRKGIINSFCWAHFRRDFIKAGKEYKDLHLWSEQWLTRIRQLYRLNRQRLAVLQDGTSLLIAQSHLEQAITLFRQQLDAEYTSSDLHPKQRTILKNARKNWEALIVFVAHPHVPMDNNRAERLLRLAALGRKNYYGCHAEWSGSFTAVCLTRFQTAALHGLNIEAYMRYILDELAAHSQSPQDLDLLLPWCIPESKLQAYDMRSGGSPCKNTISLETSAVG
jgi:transposase